MRRAAALFALFLFAAPLYAQQTDADALKLLDRVAQHYQNAEYLHLEATETSVTHNDYSDGTQRSVLSAYIAPGDRFRYQGEDSSGSGLLVSDGVNEWHLLRAFAQYAKESIGTLLGSRFTIAGDDRSMYDAYDLIHYFFYLGAGVQSAHFAPDETLLLNGQPVLCKVVKYDMDDLERKSNNVLVNTFWIDPVHHILLKRVTKSVGRITVGNQQPPYGRQTEFTSTTLYTTIDFAFRPASDTFTFSSPPGAKEVAELPSSFPPGSKDRVTERDTLAQKLATGHLGKQLPEIVVHDAAGRKSN